jgi:parvulin-like peptidyl-prolyl isomerase
MKKLVLATVLTGVTILNASTIATVNGEKITKDNLNVLLSQMPGATYDKLPKNVKDQVLKKAIDRTLLIQHAKKNGIEKTKEYKQALETIKQDLVLKAWLNKESQNIKVNEKDARKFYNDNKYKFKVPDQVKARHVLVKTEKEAKDIIKELNKTKNIKSKFIELAKSKSIGPSGSQGGDLGFFSQDKMVPEFAKVAFKLKNGEYSKTPVKTEYGYHVILTEDRKKAKTISFEEVKDNIIKTLKVKNFEKLVADETEKLKKQAKIIIK